jgi:hypothetical protein
MTDGVPRMRRRMSISLQTLPPPGDNKPSRVPRFEEQLERLLLRHTGGQVAIAQVRNDVSGTEFVLTPNALEPAYRSTLERAVPYELHALWHCEERECELVTATSNTESSNVATPRMRRSLAAQLASKPTLVVCRRPAREWARPVWLTAAYLGTGLVVQLTAAAVLYWSLVIV